MQITRERVEAEVAKLNAERAGHLAQIEFRAAQVNAVDGALIQCRAMLAILDTPEPAPRDWVNNPPPFAERLYGPRNAARDCARACRRLVARRAQVSVVLHL